MASKKEHQRKRKAHNRRNGEAEVLPNAKGEVNSLDILSLPLDGIPRSNSSGGAADKLIAGIADDGGCRTAEAMARAGRLADEVEQVRRLAGEVARPIDLARESGGEEHRRSESGALEGVRPKTDADKRSKRLTPEAEKDGFEAREADAEADRSYVQPIEGDCPWWEKPTESADAEATVPDAAAPEGSLPVTLTGGTEAAGIYGEPGRDAEPQGVHSRPQENKMYIVMVTPEVAPCAKVGGLGDVILGLGRELMRRGHEVEVICPMYACLRYDEIGGLHEEFSELWCPHGREWRAEKVFQGVTAGGLKVDFITGGDYTERKSIYGHQDDLERFAYFSRQALEFMFKSKRRPHIIHCHDWATGLVPVMFWEIYQKLGWDGSRLVYTIHNNECQGLCGYADRLLGLVGLDPKVNRRPDRLQDDLHRDCINMMKGGIVFSNFVTAVSPSYAAELRSASGGRGLQHTVSRHSAKLGGILNGIDYDAWNPETDLKLAVRYSDGADFSGKYGNKKALRDWLGLREAWRPVVSSVTRLTRQKGLDLIKHAIFTTLKLEGQFVLLGSAPDPSVGNDFLRLQNEFRDNPDVKLYLGYHEDLSHLIYAGSDIFIVPSLFEPCGLTQMISLRYGTVPVVRETGGLNDSVFDLDTSGRGLDGANGFTFRDPTPASLDYGLNRAVRLWYDKPDVFTRLIHNGMRRDYSWREPGGHYENIYNFIKA